ncbi:hypothetical protein [Ammoniphilus resinae]|uniref:Uncharacterized protein n=1 Tax=Ammoniphilus resinae TaxID=861532 RepID=A0ABS4GIP7_9BACL|nr:hypothetical protein [Ammoniphilus resinae]MBP1930131.1 hypothetical protein [Ammoniphilus resinae]
MEVTRTDQVEELVEVEEHEHSLVGAGTFISVGVVGAVILLTYIVLYGLYMSRV